MPMLKIAAMFIRVVDLPRAANSLFSLLYLSSMSLQAWWNNTPAGVSVSGLFFLLISWHLWVS